MAESSTVSRMSDYADNSLFISPDYDKVFLVAVSTKDREFDYCWWKGKILSSEAITALHMSLNDLTQGLEE